MAGPDYRVNDLPSGPEIIWNDQPIDSALLDLSYPGTILVTSPNTRQVQLIVRLQPDGSLRDVTDLKYNPRSKTKVSSERRDEYLERDSLRAAQRSNALTERKQLDAEKTAQFQRTQTLEFTFENGLVFRYDKGEVSATLNDEKLTVAGVTGRYRIKTPTFEAGVSFNPNTGQEQWQYFTPLHK